MNKTEIYYFSGTGNSLFIAQELQNRIPEAVLIPIAGILNTDKDIIKTNGETVGFVFPIHFTAIPIHVKNFIKKLDLESADYIFAAATRIGITHTAFIDIKKILIRKGKNLNSYFTVNMAGNNPRFKYKNPSEEHIKKLEAEARKKLDLIKNIIIQKEQYKEKDNDATPSIPQFLLRPLPLLLSLTQRKTDNGYFHDSKCNACGICEKVCPSKKIKLIDNKPVWQKELKCYNCMACVNYCPAQSVQISSNSHKNERYCHPYASADDIAMQK